MEKRNMITWIFWLLLIPIAIPQNAVDTSAYGTPELDEELLFHNLEPLENGNGRKVGSAKFETGRMASKDGFFDFGVKAGFNFNHIMTDLKGFRNETHTGFKFGLFSRFNLWRVYVQPELNFSMTGGGGMVNGVEKQYDARYKLRMNSLEIPVMLGFRIIDRRLINWRAYLGAYAVYYLTRSITVDDRIYLDNNGFESEKMPRWGAGALIGTGIDLWRITLDLRYLWGFTNILGDNKFQQNPRSEFKNAIFEVSVGFKLF